VSSYQRILITGGAGFVGSTLAITLAGTFQGVRVTAFDNLRRRGSERNLERLRVAGVSFVHGDVRFPSDLSLAAFEPDLIIECSAEPSAQAGYGGSPEYLVHTNLIGCFHCLEIARRTRCDVLFVSTSRVYPYEALNALAFREDDSRFALQPEQTIAGASEHGISEVFPLEGPRSLYGMTKLAAELMVEEFADAYGFKYVIDRVGLLTGPYQMAKADQGVIALWVAAHYYGRRLCYIGFGGSGKQVRDFLHIDDFCDLVIDQLRHFDRYQGRRFNVGGGAAHSLSLRETTDLCREMTGRAVDIGSAADTRPADVRVFITDHRRVSSVRGWRPTRDAATTLADIHEWLTREGAELEHVLFG